MPKGCALLGQKLPGCFPRCMWNQSYRLYWGLRWPTTGKRPQMENTSMPELSLICGCPVVVSVPCCLTTLWWPSTFWAWSVDLFCMGGLSHLLLRLEEAAGLGNVVFPSLKSSLQLAGSWEHQGAGWHAWSPGVAVPKH